MIVSLKYHCLILLHVYFIYIGFALNCKLQH